MQSFPVRTQVLVVGGGPAGSITAAFLARAGFEVVLLERAVFPRYHIGESLLPSCLEVLNLVGARELIEAHGFQRKPGAYLSWKGEQWMLDFGELHGDYRYSFQVQRAQFDHLLLGHARLVGATVVEGANVRELLFDGARPYGATFSDGDGVDRQIGFDYLVDASGRSGLMATRYLNSRQFHEVFKNVALWGYWKGVQLPNEAQEGAITVVSIPNGWVWAIPLSDDTVSIGAVIQKDAYVNVLREAGSQQAVYQRLLTSVDLVTHMTAPGTLVSAVKTETDYSYHADTFAGPGYFLAGDAACFLDPLLSSGVHLAMYSALLAAASIASVLRNEITEREAVSYYERSYKQAYMRFLVFVSAFYEVQGKFAYFTEASRLSRHDVDPKDLQHAFRNLVSGLEDFADAEAVTSHLIGDMSSRINLNLRLRKDKASLRSESDRDKAEDNARFFDSIEGLPALSPAMASNGLYVATTPQLRIARVSSALSVSHAPMQSVVQQI